MTTLMCGWSKLYQNKSNQNICLLLSKVDNIQKQCFSLNPAFSVSLLVCEFNPPRQTWYQNFIGTYRSLTDSEHHKPFLHNKILSFSRASNACLHATSIRPTRPLVYIIGDCTTGLLAGNSNIEKKGKLHSLSSGRVEMYHCAACHPFTLH